MRSSDTARWAVAATLLLAPCWASPALAGSVLGTVTLAEGELRLVHSGQAAPVSEGSALGPEDRLSTGTLSLARVELASGGAIRLGERSEVTLRAPAGPSGAARLAIEAGIALFHFEGQAARVASGLIVSAGEAQGELISTGERPAQVRLTRTGEGLELAVLAGGAEVKVPGSTRSLRAGQAVELTTRALGEPRPMPAPPSPTEPGRDERYFCPGLLVRLGWRGPEGATGYRVQVARDLNFQSLVHSAETGATHALFAPAEPRRYFWRVAARAASGGFGDFGPPVPLFCERDVPSEHLIEPADGAELPPHAPVAFSWKPLEGAKGYRVVLSPEPDLHGSAAVARSAPGPSLTIEGLSTRDHYWGVYTDDPVPQPLFLKPRKLTFKRVHAPQIKVPRALKDWGQ